MYAGYVLRNIAASPVVLAAEQWNPRRARAELEEVLTQTRGCVVEVIMKDISTVRNEPRRLWEWADLAMQVVNSGKY
ncbi:MAG: hypothetical protein HY646_05840 [Acidobacteria bacterium]|nr:hypothetical protein [Acidobacteriota bacterium]